MSVDYLRLIPTDPEYVPPLEQVQQGKQILASFLPKSTDTTANQYASTQFVDAGSNWEAIHCPQCRAILGDEAWGNLVDQAYKKNFADLSAIMPCCKTIASLNDLHYEWSVGFARFILEAREPDADVNQEQILLLESVLSCHLRKIWAHY